MHNRHILRSIRFSGKVLSSVFCEPIFPRHSSSPSSASARRPAHRPSVRFAAFAARLFFGLWVYLIARRISHARLLVFFSSSPAGRGLPIIRPGWRWDHRQGRVSFWDAQNERGGEWCCKGRTHVIREKLLLFCRSNERKRGIKQKLTESVSLRSIVYEV